MRVIEREREQNILCFVVLGALGIMGRILNTQHSQQQSRAVAVAATNTKHKRQQRNAKNNKTNKLSVVVVMQNKNKKKHCNSAPLLYPNMKCGGQFIVVRRVVLCGALDCDWRCFEY